ncbi:MAG: hypothetical protein HQL20_07595 [Candidatus Omnitrophica bacterium]|nr:hypothetical protein [Candidatus Omnitrophota bacterium]
MDQQFYDKVEQVCEQDPRYKAGAYEFVMEALNYSQRRFKKERHVTGDQLLSGIKELTVKKFGPLALNVLHHWGVKNTEDFGNIVFIMVQHQLLAKQQDDTLDSFRNGYNFEEVFHKGYRRQLEREIGRIR